MPHHSVWLGSLTPECDLKISDRSVLCCTTGMSVFRGWGVGFSVRVFHWRSIFRGWAMIGTCANF